MYRLIRNYKRVRNDRKRDALLQSETGRAELASILDAECASSALIGLLEQSLHLEGDIIECGVFRGASTRRIVHTMAKHRANKTLYACDSFEGFPVFGVTKEDVSPFRPIARLRTKFRAAADVPNRLTEFFSVYQVDGRIVKGYFEDTLASINSQRFCFIHLDSDTYSSHVFCLNALYDKLVPGGILVLDDYAQPAWPGATQAVDAFFADKPESVERDETRKVPAWFVQKR
jgi:O-methyltransferase